MNKEFEKIIEKLEKLADELYKAYCIGFHSDDRAEYDAYINAIEIVKQEAEQYNNGWIPYSEPPENDRYVLLSFENFSVPMVGRYEEDENGGAFYVEDDDETCVSQDMFVNAWMNLPDPYKPKGEIDECRNG